MTRCVNQFHMHGSSRYVPCYACSSQPLQCQPDGRFSHRALPRIILLIELSPDGRSADYTCAHLPPFSVLCFWWLFMSENDCRATYHSTPLHASWDWNSTRCCSHPAYHYRHIFRIHMDLMVMDTAHCAAARLQPHHTPLLRLPPAHLPHACTAAGGSVGPFVRGGWYGKDGSTAPHFLPLPFACRRPARGRRGTAHRHARRLARLVVE